MHTPMLTFAACMQLKWAQHTYQEHSLEVDSDNVIKVILCHVQEVGTLDNAGICYQQINGPIRLHCPIHQGINLCLVGDVTVCSRRNHSL